MKSKMINSENAIFETKNFLSLEQLCEYLIIKTPDFLRTFIMYTLSYV